MFRPLHPTLLLLSVAVMTGFSHAVAPKSPRPVDGVHHGRSTKNDEVCPEVPSLVCKNGSTCAPGVADFGKHEYLGLPTQDSGYYCKCPEGFIGHECGVKVEDCGVGTESDPRACYHGSSCRSHGGESYCDCEGLNSFSGPTDTKFAGAMCQHESTSFCATSLVGQESPNGQFCTNHGECARMVAGVDPHPGCICKGNWMGDHCEISMGTFATPYSWTNEEGGNYTANDFMIDAVVVAFFVLLFGTSLVSMGAINWSKMKDAGANCLYFIFRSGAKCDDQSTFLAGKRTSKGVGIDDKRTVAGVGDLDPDGNATLGSLTENDSDSSGIPPPPTKTFAPAAFHVKKGKSERGRTEDERTVVGVGDLDLDGSATLGNRTKDDADSSGVTPPPTETFAILASDTEIV